MDFSNRKDVRKAEKEGKLAERQRQEMVKGIMSLRPGRAWMLERLERCHLFSTTFNGDPLQSAFNEGQRNIGLQDLTDIMAACPNHYITMMLERNERDAARTGLDRDAGGPGDAGDEGPDANGSAEDLNYYDGSALR